MQKSSITKLTGRGANSEFARRLGLAIRLHRLQGGLTQTELGFPLTKGFVSAVECGHSLPSLAALAFMAERLGLPMTALLEEVNAGLPKVYTPTREDESTPPSGRERRRGPGRAHRQAAESRAIARGDDPAAAGGPAVHQGVRQRP